MFPKNFSLESATTIWAALENTSLVEPSSLIMAPMYLKWSTVSSVCPCIVVYLCKVSLFVIILVFSAYNSMPNFEAAVPTFCTSCVSSYTWIAFVLKSVGPTVLSSTMSFYFCIPSVTAFPIRALDVVDFGLLLFSDCFR